MASRGPAIVPMSPSCDHIPGSLLTGIASVLCALPSPAASWKARDVQSTANLPDHPESDALPSGGTLLYGQYTIERHLIDGGFGMTYVARDSLQRRVVIKESFPTFICRRVNGEVRPRKPDYQEQYQRVIRNFLREALRLAKLDHPNIVDVYQVFQENNTAYIAMEFVEGKDLFTILDEDPGRLTPGLLKKLLRETLVALRHVHEYDMLHRDISPDNLILDDKDKLTLIDFGAAREDRSDKLRALSTVLAVKDGYSPHEFYYANGAHEPSSDLYSVGATFYHLVTGHAPPDCQTRLADLSSGLEDPYFPLVRDAAAPVDRFLAGIDRALAVSQERRFQSVQHWLDFLDDVSTDPATVIPARFASPLRPAGSVGQPKTRDLGPDLAEVISSLVQDTNSSIDLRASPAIRAEDHHATRMMTRAHQLVDLLGNPIDDVEGWLREQDRQARKNKSQNGLAPLMPEQGKASEADRAGGWLKRALGTWIGR